MVFDLKSIGYMLIMVVAFGGILLILSTGLAKTFGTGVVDYGEHIAPSLQDICLNFETVPALCCEGDR